MSILDFLVRLTATRTAIAVYCQTPIMADAFVDKKFPGDFLVPKHETGVSQFLKKYPTYNGDGVTIAILDSGVDPKASGLEVSICLVTMHTQHLRFVQCHCQIEPLCIIPINY